MEPLNEKDADALRKRTLETPSSENPTKKVGMELETTAVLPLPGLVRDKTETTEKTEKTEKTEMDGWVTRWAPKIDDYFGEQRRSKQIKGVKVTFPGFDDAFTKLERALQDPDVPAAVCRAALRTVRAACRKQGAHENASSFPTGTETNVLEFVNVKMLWQRGDRSLSPGVTVMTLNKNKVPSAMKPDYATPSADVVGDHVRVAKPGATVDQLLGYIADDTKDKLTTYPALPVRVVVDLIPSGEGALTLAKDPIAARKAMVVAMKKLIPAEILKRLARADVLLSDTVVVAIDQADLG